MGMLQEALHNTHKGIRRISGLTEEPREVIGSFRMIPDVEEQQILINWKKERILERLVATNTDTKLIASVAYDFVNALGDRNAAETIVKGASKVWSKKRMRMSLADVLFVRTKTDGSKRSDELPFLQFCSDIGFGIDGITQKQMVDYFSIRPMQELDGGLEAFKVRYPNPQ